MEKSIKQGDIMSLDYGETPELRTTRVSDTSLLLGGVHFSELKNTYVIGVK